MLRCVLGLSWNLIPKAVSRFRHPPLPRTFSPIASIASDSDPFLRYTFLAAMICSGVHAGKFDDILFPLCVFAVFNKLDGRFSLTSACYARVVARREHVDVEADYLSKLVNHESIPKVLLQ